MGVRVGCSNTDQYSKDVQGKRNVVFVVRVTKMLGNVGKDQEHASSVSDGNGGMNLLYRIFSIKLRTRNKRRVQINAGSTGPSLK